ncbi:MAG: hypothetical protein A2V83_10015 [Nitrospirae bacterium RBG_16_64_22]|nr:MAG: hypothetical protein A2V83_10015 [Nitrospirae bacterium RBG_16_64_22]
MPIEGERRVRNLDDKSRHGRMSLAKIPGRAGNHRNVRLRFGNRAQSERHLDTNEKPGSEKGPECFLRKLDPGCMNTSLWSHADDLPLDEFQPLTGAEDPGLGHSVVLLP